MAKGEHYYAKAKRRELEREQEKQKNEERAEIMLKVMRENERDKRSEFYKKIENFIELCEKEDHIYYFGWNPAYKCTKMLMIPETKNIFKCRASYPQGPSLYRIKEKKIDIFVYPKTERKILGLIKRKDLEERDTLEIYSAEESTQKLKSHGGIPYHPDLLTRPHIKRSFNEERRNPERISQVEKIIDKILSRQIRLKDLKIN